MQERGALYSVGLTLRKLRISKMQNDRKQIEEGDSEMFLLAIRNVAEAQGGGGLTRRKGQAQPRKLVQNTFRTGQS